jgi:hypothetical protein
VANEHIHWDQATVLSQLGVVNHPVAASGARSAARLTKLSRSTPPQPTDWSDLGLNEQAD